MKEKEELDREEEFVDGETGDGAAEAEAEDAAVPAGDADTIRMEFSLSLSSRDIWIFSLYHTNRGWMGLFNLVFSLGALYYFIDSLGRGNLAQQLAFLACALLFSVVQPFMLYWKAVLQAKKGLLKDPIRMRLGEEKIYILEGGKEGSAPWNTVFKSMIRRQMIVIYMDHLRAYLIPARYLGTKRRELEALLKEKTRVSRFL